MNKAYRLIWSRAKDAWVIAAEIVKGNGGPPPITVSAIVVAASLALAAGGAYALPTAPTVINGTVNFGTTGNTLTVTNSPNSIINWQAFSIAANEAVRFNQQSALSAVLNRVTGLDPSQLLGTLQSNGKVFLINPNGIIFGQGSRIDVGGLVASSLGITNSDFLTGSYRFSADSTAGAVNNQGAITTTAGGLVWLISPNVENSGVITAPNGSVMLAAGQSVHMVDPQRPEIAVVVSAPSDQAVNLGSVLTQGGSAGIFGSLVSQQGVINADSAVAGPGGRIFLKSTAATTVAAGSLTTASALDTGDGGRIIVWSDGDTKVAGTLSATGGLNGGNGGFIETSGTHVKIADTARVSTRAASGKTGTWLIDPDDFTIAASGGDMTGADLSTSLGSTNVIIQTNSAGTSGNGDIFVNDAVTWGVPTQLTLLADRNIDITAPITATDLGAILTLNAPGLITQSAAAPITAANLELLNGTFTLKNPGNAIGTLAGNVTAVDLFNNQTLTVGSAGGATGLYASGDIRLEAIGKAGQSGIVVNSYVYGANIYMKGTGGAGANSSCSSGNCYGGNGGHGVVVNYSGGFYDAISATGNITIKGFGGNGGNADLSGSTTPGDARGGYGGHGIYVYSRSVIKSIGTSAETVRLEGTGGKGGTALGAAYDQGTAGNAFGGGGGEGILLNGQAGDRYTSANVVLIGTGGSGGDATGGLATGTAVNNGTAGHATGGSGGHGIYLYGQRTYGQPTYGYGMALSGYGSVTLQGAGGKGGFGTGGGGGADSWGGYGQGGRGGRGLYIYNSAQISTQYSGAVSLYGKGGDGGIGSGGSGVLGAGDADGGNGGMGIHVYGSRVFSRTGLIDLTGIGGNGGNGNGFYVYGSNGGAGIHLDESSVTSTFSSIQFTGTGGAGGLGSGTSGGYTGSGGSGIHLYSYTSNNLVRTDGAITLNGNGGSGGGSSAGVGGDGGIGLLVEYGSYSPFDAAISSRTSVNITGNGGSGGFGGGGNGIQGMGVQDAWAGGEGAVKAPSGTVTGKGGINLTGMLDSVTLNNSVSGDIVYTTANYGYNYGLVVSGANSVAGGGFSVSDGSGGALTMAGISTVNGLVNLQSDSDVIFTGAINAGSGAVSISSNGAIVGLQGVSSINAGSATLSSSTGIGDAGPLQTAVSTLSVYNNSSGNVQISNVGALTVNNLINTGGSITLENVGAITLNGDAINGTGVYAGYFSGSVPIISTYGCDVTITAHSPLTVNGPVFATGNISLNAGATGSPLDTLLINNTAAVSAGINATLTAGNLVTMNSPVLVGQVVPPGSLTVNQALNPPPPLITSLDVASLINDVVWTMGRESTDLSDEDNEIYQGGKNGEGDKVSYCN
ncbi:MAG: filamentous hemagglutinin N-terminal domain-containing protein [Geobacteraceae bacterium]|nr:filamentous hemagglutinin N-terminal domain-containing protein [Geobacteraceae bacterium]